MKKQSYILRQLFDVRPMTTAGYLHWERILKVKKHLNLKTVAKKTALKAVLTPAPTGSLLPDGRPAKEVFAPILTNYYQSKNIKAALSVISASSDHVSLKKQRTKILSDLESILDGENKDSSYILPVRYLKEKPLQIPPQALLLLPQTNPHIKSWREIKKPQIAGESTQFFRNELKKTLFLTGALFLLVGGSFLLFNGLNKNSQTEQSLVASSIIPAVEKKPEISPVRQMSNIPEYASVILDLFDIHRDQNILFLFQNPLKIRATGGFINSYRTITVNKGKIQKIFVNNVFNLDGQLQAKIIPPIQLQRSTTAWSMHDSNWFFNFPSSAKKIAWFYEMASGDKADAVVVINPATVDNLLGISSSFEQLFSDKENLPQIMKILEKSAAEKDIMFYFSDNKAQELIEARGWDGRVLASQNDYSAVVLSNVNGFVSEEMIKGNINLESEIADDGQIINILTVKYAGKSGADYLRVYAPLGAELIDVDGYVAKDNKAPINYKKAGFKEDKDVSQIESSLVIDQKTGTHIFEESGKTVFANWVTTNPKNLIKVIYKYRLPAKFNFDGDYRAVFQKQSGSQMELNWHINFPKGRKIISGSKELSIDSSSAILKSDFREDKILNLNVR